MAARISIADDAFQQIRDQAVGVSGVEVEDHQHPGSKFVLMTVEGYQKLRQLAYDDSEWTAEEMLAAAEYALSDPEDWGANGMDDYDNLDTSTPSS